MTPDTRTEWNIFASELKIVLADHGLTLWSLTNAGIHPQKVDRLAKSLLNAKHFPTLSSHDFQLMQQTFRFDNETMLHLSAAVVTTSVEATLMNRIPADAAYHIARMVFPVIHKVFVKDQLGTDALLTFEKGMDSAINPVSAEIELDDALLLFDQAQLMLHLSLYASEADERRDCARQARILFARVLAELESTSSLAKASPSWSYWHQEAEQGLEDANANLSDYEAESRS